MFAHAKSSRIGTKKGLDFGFPWRTSNIVITLFILGPLIALVILAGSSTHPQLVTQNIGWYLSNTLLLLLGVGCVTMSIGITCGYLVTHYTFPLHKQLDWALLLPLALPGYIAAYIYTDFLDYSGPVQTLIRELFGFESARDYWFPGIRSLPGAALIIGLVLYPYVYLLLRATLFEQSREIHQTATSLGMSPLRAALKIHLPMARPALIAGAALAMLEAVGDFGTVDYFAVATLLTGMYDLWLTLSDIGGAARLALLLTVTALFVLALERYSRKQRRYFHQGTQIGLNDSVANSNGLKHRKKKLKGWISWLVFLICLLPIVWGFILPVILLAIHACEYFEQSFTTDLLNQVVNSVKVATFATLVALTAGTLVIYTQRWRKESLYRYARILCSLGYATPAAVLAIGIIAVFTFADTFINSLFNKAFGLDTGLILTGSLAALVCALSIRFISISAGAIESSLGSISPNMDMAARGLGYTTIQLVGKYHLPLLSRGIIAAALIIFVDSMKELPATLILRPFDFETLATNVYAYAGNEQIEVASLGSLCIVIPCAVAMLCVHRLTRH